MACIMHAHTNRPHFHFHLPCTPKISDRAGGQVAVADRGIVCVEPEWLPRAARLNAMLACLPAYPLFTPILLHVILTRMCSPLGMASPRLAASHRIMLITQHSFRQDESHQLPT